MGTENQLDRFSEQKIMFIRARFRLVKKKPELRRAPYPRRFTYLVD